MLALLPGLRQNYTALVEYKMMKKKKKKKKNTIKYYQNYKDKLSQKIYDEYINFIIHK